MRSCLSYVTQIFTRTVFLSNSMSMEHSALPNSFITIPQYL